MKIAAWNMRGFNNPQRREDALQFYRLKSFDVLGILESKLPCDLLPSYLKCFEMEWDWFYSERNGRCRVLLLWKRNSVNVSTLQIHDQFINCEATCQDGVS